MSSLPGQPPCYGSAQARDFIPQGDVRAVRCYLMMGHIAAVEFLDTGADDSLIEQAHAHFGRRTREERFDGFEIWDCARRVYSWPQVPSETGSSEPGQGL